MAPLSVTAPGSTEIMASTPYPVAADTASCTEVAALAATTLTLSSRTPQPPTPMGRLMDANPTMANTGMAGPPSCTITTRYNTSSEPRLAAAVNHTTSAMRSVILRIPKTLNPSAPTATAPVTAANGTDTGASATVAVVNSSAVALSRSRVGSFLVPYLELRFGVSQSGVLAW